MGNLVEQARDIISLAREVGPGFFLFGTTTWKYQGSLEGLESVAHGLNEPSRHKQIVRGHMEFESESSYLVELKAPEHGEVLEIDVHDLRTSIGGGAEFSIYRPGHERKEQRLLSKVKIPPTGAEVPVRVNGFNLGTASWKPHENGKGQNHVLYTSYPKNK